MIKGCLYGRPLMLKAKSSDKILSPAPYFVLRVKIVILNPIAKKNLRGDFAPWGWGYRPPKFLWSFKLEISIKHSKIAIFAEKNF